VPDVRRRRRSERLANRRAAVIAAPVVSAVAVDEQSVVSAAVDGRGGASLSEAAWRQMEQMGRTVPDRASAINALRDSLRNSVDADPFVARLRAAAAAAASESDSSTASESESRSGSETVSDGYFGESDAEEGDMAEASSSGDEESSSVVFVGVCRNGIYYGGEDSEDLPIIR
jgi:hypothetical protein